MSREPHADKLKSAGLAGNAKEWTAALTDVTVETCEAMGWRCAAKGHKLDILPEPKNEYLGMDAMAFAPGSATWPQPVAVVELENSSRAERVAYSLWKLLCVRAALRILFCYCQDRKEAPLLVRHLKDHVLSSLPPARAEAPGETVLAVGYRSSAETFPFGFFRWWYMNENTRSFELFD